MKKQVLRIGTAVALALPAVGGVITAGVVHAQHGQAHAQQAQPATGTGTDAQDGDGETPVSLPAGGVAQDQAQHAAVLYVQQTAPYSTEGLTAQAVTLEDENGTVVYKVRFTGGSGQGAEVTVDAKSGAVVKAESDTPDAGDQVGAETPDGPEQVDSPSGQPAGPATPTVPGGAQQ